MGETHLVLRLLRIDLDDNSSWAEKLIDDEIKGNTPWSIECNFQDGQLLYHLDNKKQLNTKGYGIRLFLTIIDGDFNLTRVIEMAEEITSYINTTKPANYKLIHFDPANFFWITHTIVWSDILGGQQSYERIKTITDETPSVGFYERHQELILNHFHDQTFDVNLQNLLFAPTTALHPSLNNAADSS
jgi:hypothetical protein